MSRKDGRSRKSSNRGWEGKGNDNDLTVRGAVIGKGPVNMINVCEKTVD